MKYLIRKDIIKRNLFKKNELKRRFLKSIIYNTNITLINRLSAVNQLNELPKNSSYVRIKNRCTLTGRPKSVYRDFRLSRLAIRGYAHNALLSGINKSSW